MCSWMSSATSFGSSGFQNHRLGGSQTLVLIFECSTPPCVSLSNGTGFRIHRISGIQTIVFMIECTTTPWVVLMDAFYDIIWQLRFGVALCCFDLFALLCFRGLGCNFAVEALGFSWFNSLQRSHRHCAHVFLTSASSSRWGRVGLQGAGCHGQPLPWAVRKTNALWQTHNHLEGNILFKDRDHCFDLMESGRFLLVLTNSNAISLS